MKKKQIILALSLVFAFFISTASATTNTSRTSITMDDTERSGPVVEMKGTVNISMFNLPSAVTTLWGELYKDVFGPDYRVSYASCAPDVDKTWNTYVSDGDYYINLDPDGPFNFGCEGLGEAKCTF